MTGFEIAAFIRSNRSRSAVIPTKVGIQFFEFQSFPINCLSIECLDSRLRGNDESIHTETCTTSFPRTYIPSFPRKWESSFLSFSHFREIALALNV
ncbi:Uncharacterised protein [Neisseria meningitidis]|nr:Uncharacterised protein [Neisseria meningitidis]CWN71696.1 Uncharacterised protein [Neisseria meningitidis]CWT33905.1 Uncharacterised protein [Neisseria meningitidis]